jgi:hypothetical protein
MEFNFDSEEHITTAKTPSIKVLNEEPQLWISDECAEICQWKLDGIPHDINTEKGVISGNIINKPRMLILQRSSLLKVETDTGRIVKVWTNKDKKDETYNCVRKYLILFVDRDNNPLHEIPVQLTARGCFQFEIDRQLCEFRSTITKVYNDKAARMNDAWYSMCIFVPTFHSMMRGEGAKQRKACITTGYKTPTKDNWLSLCVGKRDDLANKFWSDAEGTYVEQVYKLYCDTKNTSEAKGWWGN